MRYTYPQSIILDLNQSSHFFLQDHWTYHYATSFEKSNFFHKSLTLNSSSKAEKFWKKSRAFQKVLILVKSDSFVASRKAVPTKTSSMRLEVQAAQKQFALKKSTEGYKQFRHNFRTLDLHSSHTESKPTVTLSKPQLNALYSALPSNPAYEKHLKITNLTYALFDINFIKKERLYTKLKYSRSPAYDIVSGGSAALLAGFIGFLVSEKFGIELVDSGDFYIGFMYAVFISFFIRPLLRILSEKDTLWSVVSPNYALEYLAWLFGTSTVFGTRLLTTLSPFIQNLRLEYSYLYLVLLVIGLVL